MLITGVRFRPSGSGESSSSVDLRNTRMPLAESDTAERPMMVSSRAKNMLPTRRMSGISVSAPARREPMTRSARSSMISRTRFGNCSGG